MRLVKWSELSEIAQADARWRFSHMLRLDVGSRTFEDWAVGRLFWVRHDGRLSLRHKHTERA